MNKLFLILIILTAPNKYEAQIVLKSRDLKAITLNNFSDSKYYKAIKSIPIITTMIGSGKLLDGGCVSISNTSYFFKKENMVFRFSTNRTDNSQTKVLTDIFIKRKNKLFITEDSLKVGDRVLLSTLCKDIKSLKKTYKRHRGGLFQLFHHGIYYDIKKVNPDKITDKTKVRIIGITIRPLSEIQDDSIHLNNGN